MLITSLAFDAWLDRSLPVFSQIILLALQSLNLCLESCNDFLTLVSALRQLFLDLLVQGDVSLEDFDLLDHFVMRLHQLLCVFRLIV